MPHRNIDIPTAALTEYCEHNGILKLSLFGSVLRDDFMPAATSTCLSCLILRQKSTMVTKVG